MKTEIEITSAQAAIAFEALKLVAAEELNFPSEGRTENWLSEIMVVIEALGEADRIVIVK